MNKKTLGAIGIVIALGVGLGGTYYATQLSEERAPEEWTVVFSVNETGLPGNETEHYYNETPILPLKIRITYEASCEHPPDTPSDAPCVPSTGVALRWKSGGGLWEWQQWVPGGWERPFQEIVEIPSENFEEFGPECFFYVYWNPSLEGYTISFNLTVEVPS